MRRRFAQPIAWRMTGRSLILLALAAASASLAACHDNLSAATAADGNTCYRLPTGAPARKVVLSADDDNLETCAMHVEGYRLMHRQGGSVGLYEGHIIYVTPQGISAATGENNIRYSVYTRAEQADLDGKLHQLIAQDAAEKAAGANMTGGNTAAD